MSTLVLPKKDWSSQRNFGAENRISLLVAAVCPAKDEESSINY